MSDGLKDNLTGKFTMCGCASMGKTTVFCTKHNNPFAYTGKLDGQISLTSETPALKFDDNKPILSLVPPSLEEAVGAILTMGAKKYAPNNWKKGLKYSRIVSSLKRHLNEFYKGNLLDTESGKPHLWHAACNLAFLIEYESNLERYKNLNDIHGENL